MDPALSKYSRNSTYYYTYTTPYQKAPSFQMPRGCHVLSGNVGVVSAI